MDKKDFKGHLGHYKIVQTEDNSFTLWSEYFNENCHSLSGANEETKSNYIEGTQVDSRFKEGLETVIFEVGYGLGLGAKITLEQWENGPRARVCFISTELDEKLVEWTVSRYQESRFFKNLKRVEQEGLLYYFYEEENLQFLIFIGDARQTTLKAHKMGLIPRVHAIYQDAFSPKKNPALWTVEWFETLFQLADKNCQLCTYSASNSIRKAMIEAGFKVENRKGFGAKRARTHAKVVGESCEETLASLSRSPVKALRDADLNQEKQ